MEDSKEVANKLAKVGSIAAGFADASKGTATEADITEKFSSFGPDVLNAAQQWLKDPELKDAPPAFRRFLIFDYITNGSDVIAAASNPDNLLINADASINVIFGDNPEIVAWAESQMSKSVDTTQYTEIGDFQVSVHPMIPPETKAKKCISCHASGEVGRPYPEGQKVLGYTFIAIPK